MKIAGRKYLALRLTVVAVAMFGFGYLLVPLYSVMCKITGIGGKPNTVPATVTATQPDMSRLVTVQFVTVLNEQAPWEFRPNVTSMKVHPGQLYDTTFFARNLTDAVLVATAVPSIAPGQAASHFIKTQCFCFTEQDFTPHQGRDMGVQFMVDRKLPAWIDHITLSYTFYVNHQATAKLAAETAGAGHGST